MNKNTNAKKRVYGIISDSPLEPYLLKMFIEFWGLLFKEYGSLITININELKTTAVDAVIFFNSIHDTTKTVKKWIDSAQCNESILKILMTTRQSITEIAGMELIRLEDNAVAILTTVCETLLEILKAHLGNLSGDNTDQQTQKEIALCRCTII